jgi:hypothetical protein
MTTTCGRMIFPARALWMNIRGYKQKAGEVRVPHLTRDGQISGWVMKHG